MPPNKIEASNLTRKGAGRPKGSPNKTTALLKDAILKAAENAGGGDDGLVKYLETQAKDNPGPFMALLGKVLPMQLDHGVTDTLSDLLKAVDGRTRGIPNSR